MSDRDIAWQERRLEEILFSNADAQRKSQQIIRLGFEQEIADELVERHQVGAQMPVYYETLNFDAYTDADDELAEHDNRGQHNSEK